MPEPTRRLLDSWALLALLNDEPGAEVVTVHLSRALETGGRLLMNEINVGEVYYVVAKHRSPAAAERVLDHLAGLPVEVVGNRYDEVLDAARVKASYPVSYADAFAVATAVRMGATVLTGDREFESVSEVVEVEWL